MKKSGKIKEGRVKKRKLLVGLTSILMAVAFISVSVFSTTADEGAAKSYLIISQSNNLPKGFAKKIQELNGEVTNVIPEIGIVAVTSTDPNFPYNASAFRGVRSVVPNIKAKWINPDHQFRTEANPPSIGDDEWYFGIQWGLDAIDAPEAWNAGFTGEGARVAVLDSGVDPTHPDLAPNLTTGMDISFVPYEPTIDDLDGHGTHVSGIIAAAHNYYGTIGVAPDAQLLIVKVLDGNGEGDFVWIMEGIIYAANNDADVISMSLGLGLRRSGYVDVEETPNDKSDDLYVGARGVAELAAALGRAISYAYQHGVTVVASAGNAAGDGDHDADWIHVPSDLPHTLSIAATGPMGWALDQTTDLDIPAFYTNYGQSAIDFAAPGGNIDFDLYFAGTMCGLNPCWAFDLVLSTFPGEDWVWMGGTSQAAPHVAGIAALIIGAHGGDMHPADVRDILRKSADDLGKPGKDDFYGHGRVNAYNAINY